MKLSNNIKINNIHFIKNPEGERKRGAESLFEERIVENFTNLSEGQRYPDI